MTDDTKDAGSKTPPHVIDLEDEKRRRENERAECSAPEEVVAELGQLDAISYDQRRKDEARKLGVRVTTLDNQIQAYQGARRRSSGMTEIHDFTKVKQKRRARPLTIQFSEDELAFDFVDKHGDEIRYVAAQKRWMIYAEGRWRPDDTVKVFALIRTICRDAARQHYKETKQIELCSAKTAAAVERMARADRHLATTPDIWDSDPWLLNTPAGTVDLCTGEMRAHNKEDHLTKMTAVAPGGDCPLWHRFLATVTNNDTDLQAYLQRLTGYAFTGSTREHALAFLYGTGANGKSTFLTAISGALGDYQRNAPIETFTASSSDRHPTELAMLQGARMVTATETEQGRHWAESRIKALTGGDEVTARFMRMDFFTFKPQFTLLVAGNHKPQLRNVNEAIRRRLHLVPFVVTIPKQDRDDGLADKLREEWPGILKWAIEGAAIWFHEGLDPPRAVLDATALYLDDEDALSIWIAERCKAGSDYEERSAILYRDWVKWCDRAGEKPGSQKRFSQLLQDKGYQVDRRRDGSWFLNLALRQEPTWWNK